MTFNSVTRLLVIDQDIIGENILGQSLNPSAFEVMKVNTINDGLQTSQAWNPDVIIINILQPSVNGWKLCGKIREYSQVPILVLATVSDPLSIAMWLDAGADDYLTKPFSIDILIAHLQKLTRRSIITHNQPRLSII